MSPSKRLSSLLAPAALFLAASAVPPLGARAGSTWTPPGDIDGLWDFATATPLQRPSAHADKEYFTAAEAAQFERDTIARRAEAQKRSPSVHAPYWLDHGRHVQESRRTSLIFDPPNGRIPPMTEDGRRRAQVRRDLRASPPAGPEDRNLWERCLMGFNAGPPMNPGGYNNNVLILVTPHTVALLNEMVHDTRIVPLDDQPRLPGHLRQFKGDSRGHWDGETLVVETLGEVGAATPIAACGLHYVARAFDLDRRNVDELIEEACDPLSPKTEGVLQCPNQLDQNLSTDEPRLVERQLQHQLLRRFPLLLVVPEEEPKEDICVESDHLRPAPPTATRSASSGVSGDQSSPSALRQAPSMIPLSMSSRLMGGPSYFRMPCSRSIGSTGAMRTSPSQMR